MSTSRTPARFDRARAALGARPGDRLVGVGLAVAGVFCFSLRPVLIKLAYAYMSDPITLLALRMLFSLPFFAVAAIWQRREARAPIAWRDRLAILGLGFLGYYLASFLDFLGLQYISAGLGRLVLFLYPTVVVLLSIAMLGKKPQRREVLALAVSYAGLALVLSGALGGVNPNLLLGAALAFASGVCYALYLVGGSQILVRVGSVRFSAYATMVAAACAILQFFALRPLSALALPPVVWGIAAVIGIVCTVLPIFMTSEALRRIGPNQVALIGALGPVTAIVLGWVGLDEAMTPLQLGGVVLVLGGVLLVTAKGRAIKGGAAKVKPG
jgi:drug/metabolite transporter (DMT)-like permease